MLVNPYQDHLEAVQGTRMLHDSLGVTGFQIEDPVTPGRVWTVQSLYLPISGRALGGIRAKLVDNKDFITFCNQRDLEVLLDLAKPGDWCAWAGQDYVGPGDREWFGLCADTEDLLDDLYERELMLRSEFFMILPEGLQLTRRVHMGPGSDSEELQILVRDVDLETGMCPDVRIETLVRRWSMAERMPLAWKRL